ncbi:hypothetical protein ACIA5C_12190 [Actinoplanes sp. NPDC051343]|uniref:hypothetical protein n=1 Tax=Actinoplanes sp. NPDC051343 TaxID=3363906 RepID=UPI0037989BDF
MIRLRPGPTPTPDDLRRAREIAGLLKSELDRVRTAALAWRNGLGALLVALLGFGLIKGRTDVTTLATGWAALVGVLLLAALISGAAGALALLRAAHGRLAVTPVADLPPPPAGDHQEVIAAVRALRLGVRLVLVCAALLVAAVGTTWYAPPKSGPFLQVGTACGTVTSTSNGVTTIRTATGTVQVPLTTATMIRPVQSCP